MSFHQFFRNIFGLTDRKPPDNDKPSNLPNDEFRNPIWNLDEDDDDDEDFRSMQQSPFGFRVFSDPIEIHRFFEHQMDQMLKSFQGFHNVLENFDSSPHFDSNEPGDMLESKDLKRGNLRDQYLKPSFKALTESGFTKETQIDKDLDDRVQSNGLDSILKDRPLLDMHPGVGNNPGLKIFGRSVVKHTVRRPDGTLEHHSTVKDNLGNEETTVKRQIGDQIYTVTTQIDSNGVQKRTENFINIHEGNLTDFEKRWNHKDDQNYEGINNESQHHNWFPFDKFFR